ncbi:major facilitator superfamily MFS_1 [Bacteroides coprosuis DSM 18011]|uniref:Major facilitator superfamily MFS_1 n=1 Tax=Bacteroides coprosuis DSM 18011 TaxID=679937 RepID=F3ZUP5_9BACE|nr:MFS transporter [Bacteroides coprosuis]EGJ71210.1 major facilitator superfamily MFS_1 [Bacteroides coprosuis DSM 18011]
MNQDTKDDLLEKITPGARRFNLWTFFFLYIAQSIPKSFFSTIIPVIMRQENFDLSTIGIMQLIKLPWILKFLWSPYVDKKCQTTADYKRWILGSEIVYAASIFAVALMDYTVNFNTIITLIFISFAASATQDIATDALAVLSFSHKDKSMVNSMQSMGSFGGVMIGSGLLLLLFQKIGWSSLLPYVGLFVLLVIIPLVFNRGLTIKKKEPQHMACKKDIIYFFTQKGQPIWRQIIFLFLFYSGVIGTLAMLKPYLVDMGYSTSKIGFIFGIVGTAVGFVASFIGGFIVRKIGRHHSRILFGSMILLSTIYFWVILQIPHAPHLLYLGIILLWTSYGMATIIIYTTAMDYVRPGKEGTDFTIQTVITHLSSMCVAIGSGFVAEHFGYQTLACVEVGLATLSLIYILIAFKK